jgi:hypothetical protein
MDKNEKPRFSLFNAKMKAPPQIKGPKFAKANHLNIHF